MGARLDNFPKIKAKRDNLRKSDYFRVFLHGVDLSLNFETNLNENCDNSQKYIIVEDEGNNYVDFSGYIAIQDEIMYVSSVSVNDSKTTRFEVVRAKYGSVALSHTTDEYIRSVIEVTDLTTNYDGTTTMCNPLSDLFQPVISSGYLEMQVQNPVEWSIYNPNRLYNTQNKTIMYIYEGTDGELVLQYTGFSGKYGFNTARRISHFKFEDKKSLWWEKTMDKDLIFKDENIKTILSETLDYNINKIQYSTFDYGTSNILVDNAFFNCDIIGTNEVETYGDFLKLLTTLGIRMCFDQYENLLLFCDIKVNK